MTEEEYVACMSEDIDNSDDTVNDENGGYNEPDRHRKEYLDDFWGDTNQMMNKNKMSSNE